MKERSGMPYDVVAFSTDEQALLLTSAQEGVFHRLMRHAWIHGSLPCDEIKLAVIAREPVEVFRELWRAPLEEMWTTHPKLAGRLINPKQETERQYIVAHQKSEDAYQAQLSDRQAVKGKKSGEVRRNRKRTTVEPRLNRGSAPVRTEREPDVNPLPHPNPTQPILKGGGKAAPPLRTSNPNPKKADTRTLWPAVQPAAVQAVLDAHAEMWTACVHFSQGYPVPEKLETPETQQLMNGAVTHVGGWVRFKGFKERPRDSSFAQDKFLDYCRRHDPAYAQAVEEMAEESLAAPTKAAARAAGRGS